MISAQPNRSDWKPNLTRMFIGINIYHDAMRRYIGRQMRPKNGDWFRTRVINTIGNAERKEKLERRLDGYESTSGEEGLIDVSDIPDIVSAQKNSDVIHGQLRERDLVRRMRSIRDWRNYWAHPPLTDKDCDKLAATNALDSCACVLRPIDERAANQVRSILNSPDFLGNGKNAAEKTKRDLEELQRRLEDAEDGKRQLEQALRRSEAVDREKFTGTKEDNRMLRLVKQQLEAEPFGNNWKQVRISMVLRQVQERLQNKQKAYEDTEQALKNQQAAHRQSEQELGELKRKLDDAEEKHKQELDRAVQQFRNERMLHGKTKKQLDEVKGTLDTARTEPTLAKRNRAAAQQGNVQPQPQIRPSGVPESKRVKEYRKKFGRARSRNGWTRRTEVEGWFITRWVGKKRGKDYACVFAPSRGWIEATEGPLFDQPCRSEEEAFKYLQDLDNRGTIEQRARKEIEEYNALLSMPNSMPDPVSDDDIPF